MISSQVEKAWEAVRRRFARLDKPESFVSCDCGSDLTRKEIQELLDTDPLQLDDSPNVCAYLQTVMGTIGGTRDLTYLLPGLLRVFSQDLAGWEKSKGLDEFFWGALNRDSYFAELLDPDLREPVGAYLETALLEFLRLVKHPFHVWTDQVCGLARVSDDFPRFWTRWWKAKNSRHAGAAMRYLACILFSEKENPLFLNGEHGAPDLVHQRWAVYWRDKNLEFMKGFLQVPALHREVSRVLEIYSSFGEWCGPLIHALATDRQRIEERIRALVSI